MMKLKKNANGTPLFLCVMILCALLLASCFDAGKQTEASSGKSAAEQVMEKNEQKLGEGENPWANASESEAAEKDTEAPAADTEAVPAVTEAPQPVTEKTVVTEEIRVPGTEPVEAVTEAETEAPIEGASIDFGSEETETPEASEEYVLQSEPEEIPITALPASDTVSSKQSKNLVLNADYTVTDNGDGTWGVHVLLRLNCYEIYAGERPDSGKLYLCGDIHTFSTHELSNTDRSIRNFNFFEAETTVPAGSEIDIAASWNFSGTYGKSYIEDLTLAAALYTE